MTYDAAGNQTYDCVGTHYYDAENRMAKAVQGSSNNYYFYDGNGKRVRRILNGSQTWGGQETWFVYGFDGELVAEYAYNQVTAPLATAPQKEYGYRGGKLLVVWDGTQAGDDQLKWLVTDHLGSTRMEANKSGSLTGIRRHDYLPFGEELVASTGAQRGGVGYEPPQSSVRQRFGSKERDSETGLDYFLARYFSATQGRFTGVDPDNIGAILDDPQSWNGYAYSRNSPVVYGDPEGTDYKLCVYGKCSYHADPNIDEWRRTEKISFKGGKVVDKNGTQLGTYQYIDSSHGFFSTEQMGKLFTEALPQASDSVSKGVVIVATPYAAGAGVAAGAAALGIGGVGIGTTVTTLGLSEGTVGTTAAIATAAASGKIEFAVIGPKLATGNFLRMPNANVLNLPKKVWDLSKNDAWIRDIITRRVPVFMTHPVVKAGTVYAREISQLTAAGYRQVGKWLLPPG